MARLHLALFSCLGLLLACKASIPQQKRADNSSEIKYDIAAAKALPKNCLNTFVDGKRKVICCPRGEAYSMATQHCFVPRARRSDYPRPIPPLRFTERLRELEACKQGIWKQPGALAQSQGRCADGKRFFEQNSFLSGWVEFYRGEQRVGLTTWTDYGGKGNDGDADCVVVERGGFCGTPLHFFSPEHSVQAVDE
jgi:hypothetical protein